MIQEIVLIKRVESQSATIREMREEMVSSFVLEEEEAQEKRVTMVQKLVLVVKATKEEREGMSAALLEKILVFPGAGLEAEATQAYPKAAAR